MSTRDARIRARVVGRERELELAVAALASGRDLVLEGPPGTSKTTLLRAITDEWDVPLLLAEGNAELTPAKLLGYHDPAAVLREGYSPGNFVAGPLVEAMRRGGFFYLEELNRAPADTLNVLLSAIGERELVVPRVGRVVAEPTFRVVASMNPFDNVGTTRLSPGVHDRMCRLVLGYQDLDAERAIVALRADAGESEFAKRLVEDAVGLARATREHPELRAGSSVRGAIDLFFVAREITGRRGVAGVEDRSYASVLLDSMMVALSGRIHLDDASELSVEAVLLEVWEAHFLLAPALAEPG